MGENNVGQVQLGALSVKFQRSDKVPEEYCPLLYVGIGVIEYLGEEGIRTKKKAYPAKTGTSKL